MTQHERHFLGVVAAVLILMDAMAAPLLLVSSHPNRVLWVFALFDFVCVLSCAVGFGIAQKKARKPPWYLQTRVNRYHGF